MNAQPRCVIHCRVSTGKQAYEGESLKTQAAICADIAVRNGWAIAHEPWLEAYSGRKSVRPVFDEVLAYVDEYPGTVRYYVFRAIDRFTRGGTVTYELMKQQLAIRGVELVDSMGVIQPTKNTLDHVGFEYDWSRSSPSEITEVVLATTAKAEATTILTRLIGQEISLTQQGYKIRGAVDGYKNERVQVGGKRRVIQVPDRKRAKFYRAMFELRAAGQLTDPEIVGRVNAMGFLTPVRHRWDALHQRVIGRRGGNALSVKRFQEIIQRPIYCGVVWEKWTNWRPVKASYAGLVSIDVYNAANRGKRFFRQTKGGLELLHDLDRDRSGRVWNTNNPIYPFKRLILCPSCRKPFMGSASRSRSGRHVPAYHCSRNHPRIARNKVEFEESVLSYIGKLRFEPLVVSAAAEALHRRFRERSGELAALAADIARHVADLEAEKAETVRAFKSTTSDAMRQALEADLEALDKRIVVAQTHEHSAQLEDTDLDRYLEAVSEIMEHPALLLETPVNPVVQRTRFDLAFHELPTLAEIDNGTPKLSAIMMVCEGDIDPETVRVRLSGLTWNHIRSEILRWKSLRKKAENEEEAQRERSFRHTYFLRRAARSEGDTVFDEMP